MARNFISALVFVCTSANLLVLSYLVFFTPVFSWDALDYFLPNTLCKLDPVNHVDFCVAAQYRDHGEILPNFYMKGVYAASRISIIESSVLLAALSGLLVFLALHISTKVGTFSKTQTLNLVCLILSTPLMFNHFALWGYADLLQASCTLLLLVALEKFYLQQNLCAKCVCGCFFLVIALIMLNLKNEGVVYLFIVAISYFYWRLWTSAEESKESKNFLIIASASVILGVSIIVLLNYMLQRPVGHMGYEINFFGRSFIRIGDRFLPFYPQDFVAVFLNVVRSLFSDMTFSLIFILFALVALSGAGRSLYTTYVTCNLLCLAPYLMFTSHGANTTLDSTGFTRNLFAIVVIMVFQVVIGVSKLTTRGTKALSA